MIDPADVTRAPLSGSLDEVFAEADFIPLFWERMQRLFQVRAHVFDGTADGGVTKRQFAAIQDAAHDLETFLDDYGARTNRAFAAATEFVAGARGFAHVGHDIQHLLSRFDKYRLRSDASLDIEFLRDASETLEFASASLKTLVDAVAAEAARVAGRPVPTDLPDGDLVEKLPRLHLPDNLDEASAAGPREKVAELASTYLAHKRTIDRVAECRRIEDPAERRRFVLETCDEEQCRSFTTKIHNLQSKYDTYLKSTETEALDADLPRFRGHVSVALHLLGSLTQLVHFYERHENDIRNEAVKDRIAALIDKDRVLERVVNFALYYAHAYLDAGAPVAEALLERYTSHRRLRVRLPDGVSLHARPASLIAKVVAHYGLPVTLAVGGSVVYAGSILQVLTAAGSNPGEREVSFEGDRRPVDDLKLLFEHRLGEDGADALPRALAYLKG